MTVCNRCGVTFNGTDKRETENHCGFCSTKLGLRSMNYDHNMNVITDPTNASVFIFIGLMLVVVVIVAFNSGDSFDSYYEGKDTDKKIADTIKHQVITDEFCSGLSELSISLKYNQYGSDSRKMIDAKLLECEFNEIFPDIELRKESNRK